MANPPRTAYEEALAKITSGDDPFGSSIPSYMVASDTLSMANNNRTFLESINDKIDSIPKFITASVISGASQLYNIAPDVGNLFGGDFERSDTGELIASLDSDLSAFYEENKSGVDLVGFMASSLVPGLGGIRVLNAGQKSLRAAIGAGKFGENTGKALGLLSPLKQVHIDKALLEVTTNSSAAGLLSRNALKAVGAGLGQNALEALAFEVAVTATMFKSPVLEHQEFGDFVFNVAMGAGVFGLVGGVIDGAKISFSLKRAADTAAVEARPWTFIEEAAKISNSHEKILLDYEQLLSMPKVPKNLPADRITFLEHAAQAKAVTLENRIRSNIGDLARGDQEVAETLFQSFKQSPVEAMQTAFPGLAEVTKFSVTAPIAARAERLALKMASGKASIKEIEEYASSNIAMGYVKTWGEDAGRIMSDVPRVTSLMDTLRGGQTIKVSQTGVKAGSKSYSFSTGYNLGAKAGIKGGAWNIGKATPFEAQARYIWAAKLKPFQPTATKPLTIHVDDIPLMEKAMLEVPEESLRHVRFAGMKEGEEIGTSLQEFIGSRKIELANKALESGAHTQDEIAAIVNVKSSLLNGEVRMSPSSTYHIDDIMALQSHATDYTKKLVAQGGRREREGLVDIWAVPQTLKLTYNVKNYKGLPGELNNHVIENMAVIKTNQKLYQDATSRASANVLGEEFAKLEDITSQRVQTGAKPSGAGGAFASAASSNYGSLAASVENIGGVTSRTIEKFKNRARESLEPLLYKLGNNQEAAIEWSTLNARVRNIEGEYALNKAGDALEPLGIVRWRAEAEAAVAAGTKAPTRPVLANPAMEARINLNTPEVRELAKAHIELNGKRTAGLAGIRTAQGSQFNRGADVFYPIPINPKDYPHFAMVIDESITSGNHSKTLFATSAEELEGMIKKLKSNPHLTVLTKGDAEAYHSARGTWDYEKTLSSNYLDVEAHRKGVSAPFLPATDPKKITSEMLEWHMQRETGLVREAIAAKYEVPFEELRRLGEDSTNIELSKFSKQNLLTYAEDTVKNPYADYIKTALGVAKTTDYPWWVQPNKMADAAISKVLKRATDLVETSKTPAELLQVNKLLEKAGYKGAHYDESMEIFANATPARGAFSNVVQKANSILATVVLRWDTLNAVNNAVSANVLLGAELKAVTRAIGRGDREAVGALADLLNVNVPGTKEVIRSPQKLVANAVKKFNRDGEDFAYFKENGFMTSISDQYRGALDNLTFTGRETAKSWDTRVDGLHASLRNAADKGEKWTGNRLAEEFNRFVAADVMKQLTDVAVSRNLMTGKEQLAYINTFVNRTQGNYLAAQRPMMFQGPVGQAIGLFQTYQFNLMQQLLRHVGEGHAKDSMTLLALQGTIHGMNGLPAFNAINTHIIGTASGNKEHKDIYDSVYGIAGKQSGDWLMYGAASNMLGLIHPDLKMNLYTRGDINPRHLTIVPTSPADVPIVQATAKVFGNLFNTIGKLSQGGDVSTTILQGLEHNGISRPLAGLAQTLEGLDNPMAASYSSSRRGDVIASNDFLSLANMGRVLGGKPLDEAIALDASYRFKAYALEDTKKREVLGQAIKTTMIAGANPTQEQIETFALDYAKAGGRQEEFNKWFTQLYKSANLSQTNSIQNSLNSPFTQSMQRIMGGRELRDFTENN